MWIDKQKTINLQLEMPVRLSTYRKGNAIPPLPGTNIFHSTELFHVFEMTRGYEPLLIVAYIGNRPVGKLLAVIRKSVRLFPPAIIKRCEIYGTGEYFDEEQNKEDLFGEILEHLTNEVLCKSFLIEFRNLENPLFGYKAFRRQINKALRNGAIMEIADNEKDIQDFSRMLKKAYSSQIRKHFPDIGFFRLLAWQNPEKELAKVFLVKYKGKIIGGSICLFSKESAYLWFSGGMRKTYAFLYPGILSVWAPITYAYEKGYAHLEFMDAGLPFKKHGYRDFILRFGGKQSSTRRWFRFSWKWLNKLLCKFYI